MIYETVFFSWWEGGGRSGNRLGVTGQYCSLWGVFKLFLSFRYTNILYITVFFKILLLHILHECACPFPFKQSWMLKLNNEKTHTPVIPEVLNFHHHWIGDEQILCAWLFCWTIRVAPWNRCPNSPARIANHMSLFF